MKVTSSQLSLHKVREHRWTRTIDPLIKSEMLYLLSYMLDRDATWQTLTGIL